LPCHERLAHVGEGDAGGLHVGCLLADERLPDERSLTDELLTRERLTGDGMASCGLSGVLEVKFL